jgi:hypothetical protein
MTINNGDVLRVTAKMSSEADQDLQNVYYWRGSGVGISTDAQFATACRTELDNAYGYFDDQLADGVSFDSIEIFNITQDVPVGEYTWPTLSAGGSASDVLPEQTALLVTFSTAAARSVGKKFLGGWTEGNNDSDGTIASSLLTLILSYISTILSGFAAGDLDFEAGHWSVINETFVPWLAGLVDDVWATQRRRRPGVGS